MARRALELLGMCALVERLEEVAQIQKLSAGRGLRSHKHGAASTRQPRLPTCNVALSPTTFSDVPRFTELNKVRVVCDRFGSFEGYVISSQFRDQKWIYKISLSEDTTKGEIFDNWIPEECLELTR